MQNRQYYLNPYQVDYQTRVVSAAKIQDNYHVVLENTIFYPEGGGQPADTGFIENIPVLDVYEQQGVVYHVLPTAPQNNPVNCRIDWDRRFYHMQHHTGQHLLSAAFSGSLAGKPGASIYQTNTLLWILLLKSCHRQLLERQS